MTGIWGQLWTGLDVVGLISPCFYGLQMLGAAVLPRRRHPHAADPALRFTFLVPALNEAQVIAATLQNLREQAPSARVVVIDDGSDDGTGEVVRRLAAQDAGITLLRRTSPQARQGKGAALNWAARQLLAELSAGGHELDRQVFVVADADGRIGPELLPEAGAAFAHPQVMAAQARVRIRPSVGRLSVGSVLGRVLEQQQDLEFFITRHLQRLRACWHSAALCGNGQFMRASYLAAQLAQGRAAWPDCLTEDIASGLELRLAAAAHRLTFLEAAVTQQGLPSLPRFLRQRARWSQGTLQCLGYLPRLWSLPLALPARLDLSFLLLNPWINTVLLLSLLTQPLRPLLGAPGLVLSPLESLLISGLNVGLQLHWVARYTHEQRLSPAALGRTLLGLPVYGLTLLLSLLLALWHHGSGRRTWDKSSRHAEPGELAEGGLS